MVTLFSTPDSVASTKLLPRFVTFKGDNGQLLSINVTDGVPYLTFTGLEPARLATHEVIYNKDLEDVVMIRSSNGRYWSRNEDNWIVAAREDTPLLSDVQANFKIVRIAENTIALQSLVDGSYLRWYSQSLLQHGCLAVSACLSDVHAHLEVCKSTDTALVLPRWLMLKSDNGLFLDAKYKQEINWLSFANSSGDLPAVHEVTWLPNGNVMIQNVKTCKFWRCSCVNWVWADVDQSNAISNVACHFEPVKLSNTTVAFRSVFSNKFLKRYTEYWSDTLCGLACNINDPTTHFTVGDGIVSQSLTKISYALKLAEVVEVKTLTVGTGSISNNGDTAVDMQVQVTFSTTVTRKHNWSDSSTFKAGPVASFTVGVPEVTSAQGSITVGALQCFKTRLCAAVTETVQFQSTYTVKDVEPGEEVTVKVECMLGKCRVPFTYSTKQTRVDGVTLPGINCINGVFEGVSIFNTRAVVTTGLKKTPTYLPVCCTFGPTSRGVRRAAL